MKKSATHQPIICSMNTLAISKIGTISFAKSYRAFLLFILCSFLSSVTYAADSVAVFSPPTPVFQPSYIAQLIHKDKDSLTKEEIDTVKDYAINLWEKIKAEKRILKAGQVTADKIQDFPVAVGDISPGTGTVDYAICFDKMVINAAGEATLQAYMVFDPPGGGDNSKPMVFMAKDVKFTAVGGISAARLTMLGGFTLIENSKFKVNILGSESGVIMDCNGFKSFNIGGEVLFDSTMIRSTEKKQIKGAFTLSAASWDDFLMDISFNYPFEVQNAKGYVFTVNNATIDMSESRNPTTFPASYIDKTDEIKALPNSWKGFHVTDISLQFPSKFKDQNSSPSVSLSNLIIDKEGVSVSLSVNNLISIDKGNANGWAFSIDTFGLELLHNVPVAGSMAGKIKLPVMDDPLAYRGSIDTQGNYHLRVSTTDSIRFDLWKAGEISLSLSIINLDYADEKFTASAKLTGKMTVGAKFSDDSNGSIKIPSIKFEELLIQTKSPYISAAKFGIEGQAIGFKVAGFSASINDVMLVSDTTGSGENRVGLGFAVHVTMTNIANAEFGAQGSLTVYGKRLTDEHGRHKWVYDDIELNKLKVNVDNSSFAFSGYLELFKNKPIYGTGFKAGVELYLKQGFETKEGIKAQAIFGTAIGKNQNYSYWSVDALVKLPGEGIRIGTVVLTGFGGGVSERMRQDTAGTDIGLSMSGVTYVPNEEMGLSIRASVLGSFAQENLSEVYVGLEFAFFRTGGLRSISLDGIAKIFPAGLTSDVLGSVKTNLGGSLASINKRNEVQTKIKEESGVEDATGDAVVSKEPTKLAAPIVANLHISYLFQERTFHADLQVTIDIAQIITGGGRAQMHFSPNKWYIRIGEADYENRLRLSLGVGRNGVTVGTYFMVGDDIPKAPPPPQEIADILNISQEELNYMRDENELISGKGIAFGLDAKIDFEGNFLMFYANLDAGLGFDIMLKKMKNVHCEGKTESIGVNGWYANGQIYAYMAGSVGIRIKIFKIKKDINILSLGAASLLQAKFPNPFWMRGIVGGYYSVLGGKIKGRCNFKFELGNDCKKVQDDSDNQYALEDVEIIGDITPLNESSDINIASPIKGNFLVPVNTAIDITDDEGVTNYYVIKLKSEESKVTLNNSSEVLPGSWKLSSDNRRIDFVSDQLLPSNQEIKVQLVVGFYDFKGKEILQDNKHLVEIKSAIFKTDSAALATVPLENIAYSYPLINQLNFYQDESPKGFIKLIKNQDALFTNKNNTVKITNDTENLTSANLTYNNGEISFDVPASIQKNTKYSLEIVSESGSKILSFNFRTSYYSSFKEKMEDLFKNEEFTTSSDSVELRNSYNEPFDNYEMDGTPDFENLVQMEDDLESNQWYNNNIKPFYGFDNFLMKRPDNFGYPATKAIIFDQNPRGISWSDKELPKLEYLRLKYLLPYYISIDIRNALFQGVDYCFCNDVAGFCDGFVSPCTAWQSYAYMTSGDYRINYRYVLPNGTPGTSTGKITMHYKR